MKSISFSSLAKAGAACAVAAVAGGLVTRANLGWFRRLKKPPHQPPEWLFGPVWTALYALMSISAARVAARPPSPTRSRALALWTTQLAANGAWTPLFFGAHRPRLALGDMALLVGALIGYIVEARKIDRPAAWLMAPYVGWVGYASTLNGAILLRNPGLRG